MIIVQVTNAYGPRTGGIRTHIDAIRREYAARGHRAHLITPSAAGAVHEDEAGRRIELPGRRLPLNPDYRNLWDLRRVEREILALRPDAVEILDKWTLPRLGRRLTARGVPVLGFSCERLHDVLVPYVGRGRGVHRGIDRYNRWFCRQFPRVICHSRYAAEELRRVGADNVRVLPLGVDLDRFHPPSAPSAGRELLYVGRLVPEKRVALLAEMMDHLPGMRLTVVGGGPEEKRLMVPGIELAGFVRDRAELARRYASCAVFVFPSPIETFALSVLEALACGCRVAAVDGGAVAEVVPRAAGVLVPATGAGLARAVRQALRLDPARAAAAARRTAERFSWSAAAERFLAAHDEVRRG